MKTFKDKGDRTWTIAVNVDSIKRVKSLLGLDLLTILDGKLADRFFADPILLVDTIYAICKPDADAQGITDSDFGRAMSGDAIENANTAFLEELTDFFRGSQRKVLKGALAKITEMETISSDAAMEKIKQIDLNDLLRKRLGNSSGELPGSSA